MLLNCDVGEVEMNYYYNNKQRQAFTTAFHYWTIKLETFNEMHTMTKSLRKSFMTIAPSVINNCVRRFNLLAAVYKLNFRMTDTSQICARNTSRK